MISGLIKLGRDIIIIQLYFYAAILTDNNFRIYDNIAGQNMNNARIKSLARIPWQRFISCAGICSIHSAKPNCQRIPNRMLKSIFQPATFENAIKICYHNT